MSLLALERLSVRYGDHAVLDDVSLSLRAGEVVALVGRSGSGKSTIAQAAIGLLPAAASVQGEVKLDGRDLGRLEEAALTRIRGGRIGLVFQEPASALNPALSIGRQIGEAVARHRGLSGDALRTEVVALLARVGLAVPPARYPHQLSGGQRQRVAIAIAIAGAPAVLIADEPTASLDPIAGQEIMALLIGLVRQERMALLLISHDLGLVANAADRLVVIDGGRVAEAGGAGELLRAPRSAALAAMVAALTPLPPRPARPEAEPLLTASRLGRRYRPGPPLFFRSSPVLDDVSLAVAEGETLAIVGASGSGKSTLARLILGLEPPDSGSVTLSGQGWLGARGDALRTVRRQVQAVFQDPATSLDPRQRVERIVAEPLHLLGSEAGPAERVAEALAQVGLPAEAAARYPAQFSGGQRQRIALARALILRPRLLVLDEALSALDPAVGAEMVRLLLRLQSELGLAYLFISHDLRLVRGFADRVVVLDQGRVVEQGPVAEVLTAPRHPHTVALVAAAGLV